MDPPCEHRRWTIYGYEPNSRATCLDCQQEVLLYVLYNGLTARLLALEQRLERRVEP